MRVWLDDVRPPHKHGRLGWTWAKSYSEAIALLRTGKVQEISLDHDLLPGHYQVPVGSWGSRIADDQETGFHVVLWMRDNNTWPAKIWIHSMNEEGRHRMATVLDKCGIHYTVAIAAS